MEITFSWDGSIQLSETGVPALSPTPPPLASTHWHGLILIIENPAGSTRSGKKPDGSPWAVTMTRDYGYIKDTIGTDQEGVDCFVGPDDKAKFVYIIRTREPSTGASDEDKCMLDFSSPEDARGAFYDNYDDPRYFDGITEMSVEDFKTWLGRRKRVPLRLDSKPPVPTLFLVRHAHVSDNGTDDISTQRVRGSRDVAPDDQGMQEAERMGEEFSTVPVSVIYTSGKQRARVVADAIARSTGAPVMIDPAAESWNRGDLEGQLVPDVMERMQYYAEHPDEAPPGGESRNAWLKKFGADLGAKLTEAEASGKPIVYVTHLSNILATPALVSGDRDLLPFPGDKLRTCEMLALTKPGKDWRWKKYVHLSDRVSPVDVASHHRMIDSAAFELHRILRDAAPGTQLLAAEYIRNFSRTPDKLEDLNELLTARMPADQALASTIARVVRPAYLFGRNSVHAEHAKFLGTAPAFNPADYPAPALAMPEFPPAMPPLGSNVASPTPAPDLQSPWAAAVSSIGKRGAFDFVAWTLSREMSVGLMDEPTADTPSPELGEESEFNLEADILQQALGAAGLPLRQFSREVATLALCEGRRQGIRELKDHVQCLSIVLGLPAAEFV